MAITTQKSPTGLHPIYNYNKFILTSDNGNEYGFQLPVSLVIDGASQSVRKMPQNPYGSVIFDMRKYVSNFITYDPELSGSFYKATNSYKEYYLDLYEEYLVTSSFSAVTNDSELAKYTLINDIYATIGEDVEVTLSIDEYNGFQEVLSLTNSNLEVTTERGYTVSSTGSIQRANKKTTMIPQGQIGPYPVYNGVYTQEDYLNYSVNDYKAITNSGNGKFITTLLNGASVYRDQYIYFNWYNDNSSVSYIADYMWVTSDNGTYQIDNPYSATASLDERFLKLGVGPSNLLNVSTYSVVGGSVPIIDDNTTQVTIQLFNNTNTEISEVFTYNIKDDYCDNTYGISYQFYFLNKQGSYNSLILYQGDEIDVRLKRNEYTQIIGQGSINDWEYDMSMRGKKTISLDKQEKIKVFSDWISDDEVYLFYELIESPDQYIIKDGVLYSINVLNSSYKPNNLYRQPMYSVDIEFEYSQKNFGQW